MNTNTLDIRLLDHVRRYQVVQDFIHSIITQCFKLQNFEIWEEFSPANHRKCGGSNILVFHDEMCRKWKRMNNVFHWGLYCEDAGFLQLEVAEGAFKCCHESKEFLKEC